MEIYVYSDESGVFDKKHNDVFVYGGLIFLKKQDTADCARKYLAAEAAVRKGVYGAGEELKACRITNKEKGKLYRSLNRTIKFGVIIHQKSVLDRIFLSKKDKQRYLDYAYKIGLKRAFEQLIREGSIEPDKVKGIHVYSDEHSTATNGRYELEQALEQEFKLGTYNIQYDNFFPPIFNDLNRINLYFCASDKVTLIRASDIIANRIYYMALNGQTEKLDGIYLSALP